MVGGELSVEEDETLQMASDEKGILKNHDNPQSQILNAKLTLLWSCKEAVYKWWSYGNVDFSEMIRVQPFDLQPAGSIETSFTAEETYPLQLHYKIFDGLCLAWVQSTNKINRPY